MPKVRFSRWLPGVVGVVFLTALAAVGARPAIERDLQQRAETKLKEVELPWLKVRLSARNAILEGSVLSPEDGAKAAAAVRSVWGIDSLDNQLRIALRDRPNIIKMQRGNGWLNLWGSVPSKIALQTVLGLAKANFADVKIKNELDVDANALGNDSWLSGVAFALKSLARLEYGSASLAGADLSLHGSAKNAGDFEAVNKALEDSVPIGINIASVQLWPPKLDPFSWSVKLEGKNLVISGHVPSEMAHAAILLTAQQTFPQARIADAMVIAAGAPQGWLAAVRAGFMDLAQLESGSVAITGKQVKIIGKVAAPAMLDLLNNSKTDWPQGFRVTKDVTLAPAHRRGDNRAGNERRSGSAMAPGRA